MFRMAAGIDNSNERRKFENRGGKKVLVRKLREETRRIGGENKADWGRLKTNKLVGTCLPTYIAYLKEDPSSVKKFAGLLTDVEILDNPIKAKLVGEKGGESRLLAEVPGCGISSGEGHLDRTAAAWRARGRRRPRPHLHGRGRALRF